MLPLLVSYSMAGWGMVATPVENALAGIITGLVLSGNQGPSLRRHGNVPGQSDAVGAERSTGQM